MQGRGSFHFLVAKAEDWHGFIADLRRFGAVSSGGLERQSDKLEVPGSSPGQPTRFEGAIAQLV